MSYDVTVGTQEFNYTANMGKFFREFGVHPLEDLHGEYPQEVAFRISAALLRISHWKYTDLIGTYDSPNGWGDIEGSIRFLFEIYVSCLTEDDVDTVEVRA